MINSTKRKINNKTAKSGSISNKKNLTKASLIAGAAVALVGVGYSYRTITEPKVDNQPIVTEDDLLSYDYRVTRYRLNKTKQQLSALTVRNKNENVPDYNYNGLVPGGWSDTDKNGCQTRYDILFDSLKNFAGSGESCEIETGVLLDLYTGKVINYDHSISGGGIDIDHIVAKKNAWESGGYLWSADKWTEYVNDEDVLLPVSASENRSKGDKDASEWLVPNNPDYTCQYIVQQVKIKTEYELSISADEKAAMENVLNNECKVK